MRVLHVSQPVEAGVAGVVAALAADQVERGDEVHVACPAGPGLAGTVTAAGAQHHVWAAVRSPGASVPGEVRALARIVADVDPDVVVLHSAKAGLAGRLAIRGARPTAYVPHAWSFEAVSGVVGKLSTRWEVAASRFTDVVVCVSADERERGRAVGVTARAEVIPNGVDTHTRTPRDRTAARTDLGLPDAPTVVCVGRLAEQKGQDLLLQAWARVRAAVPDAHLVLVGDGPHRERLEAAAPAGVTFAGTRTDVDTWFAAADVVALPSRWESTPLVSLEAMAAARPVVAFDVDGVRTTLGDTGVVLAQGDVDGFAHRLRQLLTDPVGARTLGRAARERVEAVGDLSTGLKQWHSLLTELAAVPGDLDENSGPPVTVVVTVLNEGSELVRLARELLEQTRAGDEIVIVDGGSTDRSLDALPDTITVVHAPGAGISEGRNIGVREARNDVIVVTDAGCTPEAGFLDGFRRRFAGDDRPALVSGVYRVLARDAMEEAQSLACYPQPSEVDRPDPLVRAYTKVFGTGFDPRFAVGRCMAFTRDAFHLAGGFPEHLATGEDVSFGLALARHGRVETAPDAVVGWTQRNGVAATWRMYRGYGRSSTDGGDPALLVRDGARGLAYVLAPALLFTPAGRALLTAGTAAYLSLPVVRAVRARAGLRTVALLPVAMATKDLGKLAGAVQGLLRKAVR